MQALKWAAGVLAAGFLAACGPTVGDSCTTPDDCGEGLCINALWAPGGYCSNPCTQQGDDACPAGSTCVTDALGLGVSACLRSCTASRDCRSGYTCEANAGADRRVCVGASGF